MNDTTPAHIGADALRVAAQAALTALENLHEIDTETECITIDVRDEIDALRAALASTAQPAVVAPTVEQVEEAVGMGHCAWDCIAPDELIAAVLRLAAAPKAAPTRWYMINAVGMATLCADKQDAEQAAADARSAKEGDRNG